MNLKVCIYKLFYNRRTEIATSCRLVAWLDVMRQSLTACANYTDHLDEQSELWQKRSKSFNSWLHQQIQHFACLASKYSLSLLLTWSAFYWATCSCIQISDGLKRVSTHVLWWYYKWRPWQNKPNIEDT